MLEARGERRLVAEVARQVDHAHARVGVGDAVEQLGRAVGGAVVDEHQLERVVGDRGDRAGDELLDQLLLVVDGRHDAEQGGGARSLGVDDGWGLRHGWRFRSRLQLTAMHRLRDGPIIER